MYLPRSLDLVPRYYCNNYGYYSSGGYYNNCRSSFSRWGRWVLAGVLIFGVLVLLALFACFTRRRRSRLRRNQTNTAPMNAQPPMGNYGNNDAYTNQQSYNAPPGPPPAAYGEHAGYYGQQSGIAQPGQTYQPYNK